MDPWYLVFVAFGVALGVIGWRDLALGIWWRNVAALLFLSGAALGGVAAIEALMAHVGRWTPEPASAYASQPFHGGAALERWTTHKQRRERDGCSTGGSFERC